jgi:hypothetical protein
MRTSELHAKLLDHLVKKRNREVMDGLNPVSAGVDVTYEFGRRIGNRIGMDYMIEQARKFFEGEEETDKKL